nr:MetaGeneMark_Unknown Function [uncultured bacterium]
MAKLAGVDRGVMYCLREDVKRALDVQETARTNTQIDRAIRSATPAIEAQMGRIFYPLKTVAKFDWPQLPYTGSVPWRLWLDEGEILTLDTLTSGDVVIGAGGYFLEPVNSGPPYSHVDINLGSSSVYAAGATWQQSTTLAGTFGYTDATEPAGSLAAAVADTTATSVTIGPSNVVGVGSILLVDSERMMVIGRSMADTAQTLQADLGSLNSATVIAVGDGSKFAQDETILIDGERMLIVDIAGDTLVVKRAWDGSVLAAHTQDTHIYAPRLLAVIRGALGTTPATHMLGAAVGAHIVPPGIRNLAVAEAMTQLLNEQAGYARTVGSGDNVRDASGAQLKDLRALAVDAYARKARVYAI